MILLRISGQGAQGKFTSVSEEYSRGGVFDPVKYLSLSTLDLHDMKTLFNNMACNARYIR